MISHIRSAGWYSDRASVPHVEKSPRLNWIGPSGRLVGFHSIEHRDNFMAAGIANRKRWELGPNWPGRRCDAKAKHTGRCCKMPAMRNGKCYFHGGAHRRKGELPPARSLKSLARRERRERKYAAIREAQRELTEHGPGLLGWESLTAADQRFIIRLMARADTGDREAMDDLHKAMYYLGLRYR
jgi:hypothetical protein